MCCGAFIHPKSVVHVFEQRPKGHRMKKMSNASRRNNPLRMFALCLQGSRYPAALACIWRTRNFLLRLDVLRKPEFQVHGPILLERGVMEFVVHPSLATLNLVSVPLLIAGYLRILQDTECSSDLSVWKGNLASRIRKVYLEILDEETPRKLGISLKEVLSKPNCARGAAIQSKIKEIIKQTEAGMLPKPDWISWSGTVPLIYNTIAMKPQEEHRKIRLDCANAALAGNI